MARTAVTIQSAVRNGALLQGAGAVIAPADGASVDVSSIDSDKLLLIVLNSAVAAKDLTVKAGVGWSNVGQGDLVQEIGASEVFYIGPLETARFLQADGKIYLDFEAAMTGTVNAVRLP